MVRVAHRVEVGDLTVDDLEHEDALKVVAAAVDDHSWRAVVDRNLEPVMLLLRAEGLHRCPQTSWAKVRKTVAEAVSPPDEPILFCGMSIGYEDVAVDYIRTGRAPLDETVTFIGDFAETEFPAVE